MVEVALFLTLAGAVLVLSLALDNRDRRDARRRNQARPWGGADKP